MGISFPTNTVGDITSWDTKMDWSEGYTHNGTRRYRNEYNHSFPKWRSIKRAITQGDRVHDNDYYRHAAVVEDNSPHIESRRWKDGNGWRMDTKNIHLSQWLPDYIVTEPPGWPPIVENLKSQCLTEARNKLREGKLQNGADIGQARQTANMIASTFSQLLAAYKAAKRGQWDSIPGILGISRGSVLSGKYPANRWLEYQYGWKPLMNSISDNVDLLKAQKKKSGDTFKVSRSLSDSYKWIYKGDVFTDEYECTVKVKVGFKVRLTNSVLHQLDTVGFINPLSIAWELTPFSFVFDWFIPVGNVLESLSATQGLSPISGYRSTVVEVHKSSHAHKAYHQYYTMDDPGKLTVKKFSFSRERIIGFPLPELYGKRNPFSTTHIASALALLRQLL